MLREHEDYAPLYIWVNAQAEHFDMHCLRRIGGIQQLNQASWIFRIG
jgi:hypothetical protein